MVDLVEKMEEVVVVWVEPVVNWERVEGEKVVQVEMEVEACSIVLCNIERDTTHRLVSSLLGSIPLWRFRFHSSLCTSMSDSNMY